MVAGTFASGRHADRAIQHGAGLPHGFTKRCAFAMIADLAVSSDRADAAFRDLFPLIRVAATDERNEVKKAVNWALPPDREAEPRTACGGDRRGGGAVGARGSHRSLDRPRRAARAPRSEDRRKDQPLSNAGASPRNAATSSSGSADPMTWMQTWSAPAAKCARTRSTIASAPRRTPRPGADPSRRRRRRPRRSRAAASCWRSSAAPDSPRPTRAPSARATEGSSVSSTPSSTASTGSVPSTSRARAVCATGTKYDMRAQRALGGKPQHAVPQRRQHPGRRGAFLGRLVHHVQIGAHPCQRLVPLDPAADGRIRMPDADAEDQPVPRGLAQEGRAPREHLRLARADVRDAAGDRQAIARAQQPRQVRQHVVGAAAFGDPQRRIPGLLDRAHIPGDRRRGPFVEPEGPHTHAP